jgi:hypothetical protein
VLDEARCSLKEVRDSEPDNDRREDGDILEHTMLANSLLPSQA